MVLRFAVFFGLAGVLTNAQTTFPPPGRMVDIGARKLHLNCTGEGNQKEVAGLVFSNSANRVGRVANGKAGLIWDMTEDEIRATFPLPSSSKGPAPAHEGEPSDRLPRDLQAVRLWCEVRLWEKWDPAGGSPESMLSWRKEFLREFEETDAGAHPLGSLPVTVVSSGPIASQSERLSRNGAAARLDFLSSNSVHVVAQGSGHEIHLFQPDVVADALARSVAGVRSRAAQK